MHEPWTWIFANTTVNLEDVHMLRSRLSPGVITRASLTYSSPGVYRNLLDSEAFPRRLKGAPFPV
ncbi:MAG TPA: hypothetical protein DIU35_20385 [Candidatus Latescibacteria bacterium]|nr:hypothetical protein [Gemmatimonadota bacterium]HCR19842.1 hypothetical protein [Candidatus Latescibacterota bacterium]|tara:strand:- start:3449 stop:3643 length:195 start_codon:yes stop_codon:yes gene_type:complete